MEHLARFLFGSDVYATLRPKAAYQANLLERLGGTLVYVSQLGRALAWPTAPFWLYYCAFRMHWSTDTVLNIFHLLVTYHSLAYGLRTAGRLMNPVYRTYIQMFADSARSREVGEKLLNTFDFEITKASPVAFEAKKRDGLWYLDNHVDLPNHSETDLKRLRVVASACIHTFGRRMLYPGSVGVFKALLSRIVQENRLKLMLEMGGKRNHLRTVDGNVIDTILFDRREPFPDSPLVICSDGNAGFYETGIMRTPVEMDFSVLGWNPPGFSESTGTPFPDQILNAMDAVIQFAESKGFRHDQILLFGWSIGGFPSSWAAANYPDIGALILDATFDDIMPLAITHMPGFAENIVKLAIRENYNLNVAEQLARYNGPVRIIRRYNDEVITTYQGPDAERSRRENRGNHLLAKFLRSRFPQLVQDEAGMDSILEYVNATEQTRRHLLADALNALEGKPLKLVEESAELRAHAAKLLAGLHFSDVFASHTTPLRPSEFLQPHIYRLEPFEDFLSQCREIFVR